jgi:hypothetical protein
MLLLQPLQTIRRKVAASQRCFSLWAGKKAGGSQRFSRAQFSGLFRLLWFASSVSIRLTSTGQNTKDRLVTRRRVSLCDWYTYLLFYNGS